MDIRKVEIVSRKDVDSGFEYYIRMPNRRMIMIFSDRELDVGAKVYIVCDYVRGNFENVKFA